MRRWGIRHRLFHPGASRDRVVRGWAARHASVLRPLCWLTLSVISFTVAGHLTRQITRVNKVVGSNAPTGTVWTEGGSRYAFSVFAAPGTSGRAVALFDYPLGDPTAVLSFHLPPGSQRIRITRLIVHGCHYLGPGDALPGTGTGGKVLPEPERFPIWVSGRAAGFETVVDVSGLAFDDRHSVDCDVVPAYLREGFVTTVMLFLNDTTAPFPSAEGRPLVPVPIELRMNNDIGSSEVISGSNPEPMAENAIVLNPADHVAVRWRWIEDEQRRDVYLVLIGTFIAFGAAMFIETVRPFIDSIGGRTRTESS
jgi:hypothetical protein